MAVTAAGSGTQTAVIATEHTLLNISVAGTFTLHVDRTNMQAGDVVELRVYQIVLTGGTREVAYYIKKADAPVVDRDVVTISVPISNELTDSGALRFTLKQTTGTGRAYPWKVLSYG